MLSRSKLWAREKLKLPNWLEIPSSSPNTHPPPYGSPYAPFPDACRNQGTSSKETLHEILEVEPVACTGVSFSSLMLIAPQLTSSSVPTISWYPFGHLENCTDTNDPEIQKRINWTDFVFSYDPLQVPSRKSPPRREVNKITYDGC